MSTEHPTSCRILVVGINYAPENVGTGKYTGEMCTWLASRGHRVRVITAPPYYPSWQVARGYRRSWYHRESLSGVDVVRCPLWVPKVPSGGKRLLHLASFAASAILPLLAALAWRPTHVVCVAPTLAAAPAAFLTSRLSGAASWLHIQDFELDAALDMGIVSAGPLKRAATAVEQWILRRFDRVSTISPKMVERLHSKQLPDSSCILFENWVDINAISPLETPSPYRKELGIPNDAIVALYSGNMGLKQGLELLGEAAVALQGEPNLYFVFGGQGPGRAPLERQCAMLPNVRFLDLQPAHRMRHWLGLADIHLLPQRADVADLVMPSKLGGMLASGRPILATAAQGTGVALAVEHCGMIVEPGDTGAFTWALRRLASRPEARSAMGANARKRAVTQLSQNAVLHKFEHELTSLTGTHQKRSCL